MSSNNTPDYNLTDIDDEPSYADIADEDGNKFEQEIQRDQPFRPLRRNIDARFSQLLNQGEKINEPLMADQ